MIHPERSFEWSRGPLDLQRVMDAGVVNWLEPKQRGLLIDYVNIQEGFKQFGISSLSDYSYLITPAFKALEGVLIQIAEELQFDVEAHKHSIGAVFDEDKLALFYENVLEKLEELSDDNKEDIKMWLNDARRILRHFRHSPAHFNGEVKESWDKAFQLGDQIVSTINQLVLTLLDSNLIGKA